MILILPERSGTERSSTLTLCKPCWQQNVKCLFLPFVCWYHPHLVTFVFVYSLLPLGLGCFAVCQHTFNFDHTLSDPQSLHYSYLITPWFTWWGDFSHHSFSLSHLVTLCDFSHLTLVTWLCDFCHMVTLQCDLSHHILVTLCDIVKTWLPCVIVT